MNNPGQGWLHNYFVRESHALVLRYNIGIPRFAKVRRMSEYVNIYIFGGSLADFISSSRCVADKRWNDISPYSPFFLSASLFLILKASNPPKLFFKFKGSVSGYHLVSLMHACFIIKKNHTTYDDHIVSKIQTGFKIIFPYNITKAGVNRDFS